MRSDRFDVVARAFSSTRTRRSFIGRGGSLALGAAMLGAVAPSSSLARSSTPEAAPEVPADAPCMIPFSATVRQGPNAGTTYLGYLALVVAADGATTGVFLTDDEQTIHVAGQLVGHSVNLLFTPAGGGEIFGVGTSLADLAMCHGAFYTPMGGPLVGPGEGDLGDWAVITDYDQVLNGTLVVNDGAVAATARTRRSPMCRSCVQACKTTPGITDVDLCSSFCGPLFGGPCTCDDPGFTACP